MTLGEIITRGSVRTLTDEPVSKEAILKLLDMALWAPYGHDPPGTSYNPSEEVHKNPAGEAGVLEDIPIGEKGCAW